MKIPKYLGIMVKIPKYIGILCFPDQHGCGRFFGRNSLNIAPNELIFGFLESGEDSEQDRGFEIEIWKSQNFLEKPWSLGHNSDQFSQNVP